MDGVVSLKSPHVVEFEFCDLRELWLIFPSSQNPIDNNVPKN